MKKNTIAQRQFEIAAESYAASLLARIGYDVLVQYGPVQPHYDLAAVKGARKLLINVKASTDGGWPLAVSENDASLSRSEAIEAWFKRQREDVIFLLVQFHDAELTTAPRVYVATGSELRVYMLGQHSGEGDPVLWEDYRRDHPKSRRVDRLPAAWRFSQTRLESV